MGSIHNNTTQFLMKQAKYTTTLHIPNEISKNVFNPQQHYTFPNQIGKNAFNTTIPNEISKIHNNTTQFIMIQAKYTTTLDIPNEISKIHNNTTQFLMKSPKMRSIHNTTTQFPIK